MCEEIKLPWIHMHLVTLVAEAPISMRANFPDMINSINITPLKLTLGVCSL